MCARCGRAVQPDLVQRSLDARYAFSFCAHGRAPELAKRSELIPAGPWPPDWLVERREARRRRTLARKFVSTGAGSDAEIAAGKQIMTKWFDDAEERHGKG